MKWTFLKTNHSPENKGRKSDEFNCTYFFHKNVIDTKDNLEKYFMGNSPVL